MARQPQAGASVPAVRLHDDSLSTRLVAVAHELRSEPDPLSTLDRVAAIAAEWGPKGSHAGISLLHRKGRIESVAATSELVRIGDDLQVELNEGPCLDAARDDGADADQIVTGDLYHDHRWPHWGPRVAEQLHVSSMLCTRLFTNETSIGALNVYSVEDDAFDSELAAQISALSAHASIAVATSRQIDQLFGAVDRRTVIGTAVGIVMERFQVDSSVAFAVLTRLSSRENRKIHDIAQGLISTGHLAGS
jgi:GAF domain-containing protein